MQNGNIPLITIDERTIPEAFETAMKRVWNEGIRIRTEYDHPEDPPSRDATVAICIREPFGQPRFHRCFADGLGGLGEYVQEVVHGAHDYWVKPVEEIAKGNASKDTHWTYTYHGRLFEYHIEDKVINQIQYLIDKLIESGHSRRAQAITWNTRFDPFTYDPPCLQRIWGRLCEDEKGQLHFNMNTHWRSRDLYKAWFENVIALTTLMRKIAGSLSGRLNREVKVGRYVDISDSLHIYGSYFNQIEVSTREGVKGFFDMLERRPFEERTWNSDFVKQFFIDDGIGKGVKIMLQREQNIPAPVRQAIEAELKLMEQEGYVV